MTAPSKKPARGFALIEALVAMVVLSFGMLAVAGFQTTLSLNSDVAKQRTEATRLAQQKLEQLRTFSTLTAYGTQMVSSTSVSPATQETITTNATFTRSWGVSNANDPDTGRAASVTVAWTDRAGNAQQVQLLSHVSATDPLLVGGLWFPLPDGTILRRPKNRSIDIPIPAISITGTGKSYVPWTGISGGNLVFSDNSGDIVQKCTTTPTAENLTTNTCVTFDGYLLTGYITGTASKVALVTKIVVPFTSAQYISGTPECSVAQAYDQNASTPTAIAATKYYVCLIQPTDHDTNASTARVWSGRTDLAGATNASLAGTQVCRFSTDATTTVNNNHPAIYRLVDRSLDNQNFYISSSCADASASRVLHLTNSGTFSAAVTYDGNGFSSGTVPTDTTSYTLNAMVTVQSKGSLVKTDTTGTYSFAGWNTLQNGSGTARAAASTFAITDDTTLYAQWTAPTTAITYTVAYNSNGGTGTLPKDALYAAGSTVTVLITPAPSRTGFTFNGWSLSLNGAAVTTFAMPASNTSLYAKWQLATPNVNWDNGKDPVDLIWSTINGATGYKVKSCSVSNASDCTPTTETTQTALKMVPIFITGSPTTSCYQVIATHSSGDYDDSAGSSVRCMTKTDSRYAKR